MTAPKAKTFQERFGFVDGELKTPLHDEIMFWLDGYLTKFVERKRPANWGEGVDLEALNQERLETIARERKGILTGSVYHNDKPGRLKELEILEAQKPMDKIPDWEPSRVEKEWEHTVSTSSKFVVGFIDMFFKMQWHTKDVYKVGKSSDNFDLIIDYEKSKWEELAIYFEVKTTIPSVGELLRQVNFYKEYLPHRCNFAVVCPDDRFKDILKSQGVDFLKYPGKE